MSSFMDAKRVIVAHTQLLDPVCEAEPFLGQLAKLLGDEGFRVEFLRLPPLEGGSSYSRSLMAFRLLPVESAANAVLCLDAPAAVLDHPNKIVWLVNEPVERDRLTEDGSFDRSVLLGGIREAKLVVSAELLQRLLKSQGLASARKLSLKAGASGGGTEVLPSKKSLSPLLKALRS